MQNEENPSRCFARLYRLYISKLAPTNSFNFKPLQKFSTEGVWYSKQPIGHKTFSKMIANLCSKAVIKGFKTSHSLRATTASRLYHNGIDKQLIMERTGHRSLDGVRLYKRTNEEQQIAISRTLQKSTSTATKTSTEEIENKENVALTHLKMIKKHQYYQDCNYTIAVTSM